MSVNAKMTAIANAIREKVGGTAPLTLDQMAEAIIGISAGSAVKTAEYIITEDADRSLWINEQGIHLVRGINIISIGWVDGSAPVNNRSGLTTLIILFWNGQPASGLKSTAADHSPLRALFACTNGYNIASAYNQLVAGNTSAVDVSADGLLTFKTSATSVTVGVYNNSFIGAGNVYRLLQVESEEVA